VKRFQKIQTRWLSLFSIMGVFFSASPTWALDLDWSGQFRTETNWLYNYSFDSGNITADSARMNGNTPKGYYIPGGGSKNAFFQTLFLKLRPNIVVNDNIYIKSEWWVGNPIFGMFGNLPYTLDQRNFYSNQSRGSAITAQRVWAEFLSDVGVIQVGRAPLHWGLGVVWNSGDSVWDRYMSTGDVVRMVSKFGSFKLIPGIVKYSNGNNVGGACTVSGTACTPTTGTDGLTDYSLGLLYESFDDEIEVGVNFIRRIGGAAQDPASGVLGFDGTPSGMNYNVWDIYAKKGIGPVTLAVEAPIVSGEVDGVSYSSYAIALEADWEITSFLDTHIKAGRAPGQPSIDSSTPDKFRPFYFNPAYRLGHLMFNYQFANFAGPNTQNNPQLNESNQASPYDNPITNANYLSWNLGLNTGKWKFDTTWTFGWAVETASGTNYFNSWRRKFESHSGDKQSSSLGWEMDYGLEFEWDEGFLFGWTFGWFFPGEYFAYSATSAKNSTSPVFGTTFRAGISF
tara:strand:- start:1735 stop:3267 length:1533 start_codon:yes stop_codon:yes gene_type:complete